MERERRTGIGMEIETQCKRENVKETQTGETEEGRQQLRERKLGRLRMSCRFWHHSPNALFLPLEYCSVWTEILALAQGGTPWLTASAQPLPDYGIFGAQNPNL